MLSGHGLEEAKSGAEVMFTRVCQLLGFFLIEKKPLLGSCSLATATKGFQWIITKQGSVISRVLQGLQSANMLTKGIGRGLFSFGKKSIIHCDSFGQSVSRSNNLIYRKSRHGWIKDTRLWLLATTLALTSP